MTLSLLLDYSNLIVPSCLITCTMGAAQSENETSVIIFISTRRSSSFSTFSLRQYGTGCGLKNRGTELGSTKSLTEAPFKVPKWVLNNFLCLAMRESNGDVKWSIVARRTLQMGWNYVHEEKNMVIFISYTQNKSHTWTNHNFYFVYRK